MGCFFKLNLRGFLLRVYSYFLVLDLRAFMAINQVLTPCSSFTIASGGGGVRRAFRWEPRQSNSFNHLCLNN